MTAKERIALCDFCLAQIELGGEEENAKSSYTYNLVPRWDNYYGVYESGDCCVVCAEKLKAFMQGLTADRRLGIQVKDFT